MPQFRPLNLKISVMIRVILGALACAIAAAAYVVIESERETTTSLELKSEMITQNLQLQLLRIEAGFDTQKRFPDWEFLADHVLEEGLCIRLLDGDGNMVRASCLSSQSGGEVAPDWFSTGYSTIFVPGRPHVRVLEARGKRLGTVEVTLDPAASVRRAWLDVRRIASVTGVAVLVLCLLVYLSIDRALKPTGDIVAGLNRLAAGDLSHRLPRFRLIELERISEVVNHMAAQLEASIAERQELARRLVIAQEDERRHLARELHDEFGQSLAAINAIAASIEATANAKCAELVPEAQSLSEIVIKMMGELRSTLVRLRPAIVEEIGLVESLKTLIAGWNARLGTTTRFVMSTRGDFGQIPDAAAVNLYRIAQEGLTNAAKHSDARLVTLTLERMRPSRAGADNLALTIADDGKGCDGDKVPSSGLGLSGVRERIAMFGGSLAMSAVPLAGTTLAVTLPLPLAQEAA